MRRHFYGVTLAALGLWELSAFASRGRIPTVTGTVRPRRWRQAILLAWMLGAVAHVTRGHTTPKSEDPSFEG